MEVLEGHLEFALLVKGVENIDHKKKEELKRKCTGSKKCDCPFQLVGLKVLNGEWKLKITCGFHNHAPSTQLEGHSYAGWLTEKEKEILNTMSIIS